MSTETIFGVALTLITGLGTVAWKLLQLQVSRAQARADLAATQQDLKDAEARYQRDLEVIRQHFAERHVELTQRQDREFERVKGEMDEIKNTMREFQRETQQSFATQRKEQQEGVDRVLTRMQELLVSIKRS